jgi:hypothetical protein
MLLLVTTNVKLQLQETNTLRQSADYFCPDAVANASQSFFANSAEEQRSQLIAARYSIFFQLLLVYLGQFLATQMPKVKIFLFRRSTVAMLSSAATTISSATIFDISLSIPYIGVASFAASATASASALAAVTILAAEAEGSVRSMACITLTILHFFCPSAFSFAAEGCSFFCKNFISSGPRGLSSLMGRESVITFKISAISAPKGVAGASSVSSIFGSAEEVISSLHF